MFMNLELSDKDARTLQGYLRDVLPSLRREVARTDQRDMRHLLAEREELCEQLLVQLNQTLAGTRS
jgi:hypothetical protein